MSYCTWRKCPERAIISIKCLRRRIFAKGYKGAITAQNLEYTMTYLKDTYDYLKSLMISTQSILGHRRKTFANGFLCSIKSITQLASILFNLEEEERLRYFLCYKISHDHLELFFNCIRGQNGHNDNPNVVQFKSALKKTLMRNYITPTSTGNCSSTIEEGVSGVFSLTPAQKVHTPAADFGFINSTTYYADNVLFYIAGFN